MSLSLNSQEKKIGGMVNNRFSFSIGMGISMNTAPSLVDYIRADIPFANKDSVSAFGVGLEFFGALEYDLSSNFALKLDYSYFIKSQSYNYSYFTYDYFYLIHQPYVIGSYVLRGNTYRFNFGAGLGYHFAKLKKDVGASSEQNYSASGIGYRGEVIFMASLSNKLSSYAGGFLSGSSIGKLKEDGNSILKNPQTGEEVNLGSFGIGLRLGITLLLN